MGDSWGSMARQHGLLSKSVRDLVSKNRVNGPWGYPLAAACTCMHLFSNTWICTHTTCTTHTRTQKSSFFLLGLQLPVSHELSPSAHNPQMCCHLPKSCPAVDFQPPKLSTKPVFFTDYWTQVFCYSSRKQTNIPLMMRKRIFLEKEKPNRFFFLNAIYIIYIDLQQLSFWYWNVSHIWLQNPEQGLGMQVSGTALASHGKALDSIPSVAKI